MGFFLLSSDNDGPSSTVSGDPSPGLSVAYVETGAPLHIVAHDSTDVLHLKRGGLAKFSRYIDFTM
jgi:hypothetical protein